MSKEIRVLVSDDISDEDANNLLSAVSRLLVLMCVGGFGYWKERGHSKKDELWKDKFLARAELLGVYDEYGYEIEGEFPDWKVFKREDFEAEA